jgi:hypothetical protein
VNVRSPAISTTILVAAAVLVASAASARAESPGGAAPAPAQAAPAEAPSAPAPHIEGIGSSDEAPPSLAAPLVVAPAPLVAAPVPKAKRVPLARRWWFWASLGTAAVGVVLAALFIGPREPYSGNAMPGIVQVF